MHQALVGTQESSKRVPLVLGLCMVQIPEAVREVREGCLVGCGVLAVRQGALQSGISVADYSSCTEQLRSGQQQAIHQVIGISDAGHGPRLELAP